MPCVRVREGWGGGVGGGGGVKRDKIFNKTTLRRLAKKKKGGMASLALPRPGLLARLATALEEGVLMMGERDGLVRVGARSRAGP